MKKPLLIFTLVILAVTAVYITKVKSFKNSEPVRENKLAVKEVEPQIYSYEAQDEQSCAPDETYDAQNNTCSYSCTDTDCEEYAQDAENELSSWADQEVLDAKPVAEKPINDSEGNVIASYEVLQTENLKLKSGQDSKDAREIWKTISGLSPDDFTNKYIDTYELTDDPQSDTLAYVADDNGDGKWLVSVNLSGHKTSTSREQASTLIHELTHIITLNFSQIDPNISQEACKTYHTGSEGCTKENSYLNKFVSKFWSKNDLQAVQKEDAQNGSSIYEAKKSNFLTEYASTNPIEDAAESFSFFVLNNKASANTIAGQKQDFYYDFSELVALRESMRKSLIGYIVREKKQNKNP